MVCRQKEEDEGEEEGGGSGLVGMVFFVFCFHLNLRQETECLVGRGGERWESGDNRN